MADVSLDDYIQQNGIGIKKGVVGNNLRLKLNEGNNRIALKRPISATVNKIQPLKTFDARQKLSGPKSDMGMVPDARQKLVEKAKFSDARQHILSKKQKLSVGSGIMDARAKLQAKRGIINQAVSAAKTPVMIQLGNNFQRTHPMQLQNQQPMKSQQRLPQLPYPQPQHQLQIQHPQLQQGQQMHMSHQMITPGWGVFNPNVSQLPHQSLDFVHQTTQGVGVMNFGGTLMKTISSNSFQPNIHLMNQPTFFQQPTIQQPINQINASVSTVRTFQQRPVANANQKLIITKRNSPSLANATSAMIRSAARPGFQTRSDEQVIETLISQPPVKLVPANLTSSSSINRIKQVADVDSGIDAVSPLQGFRVLLNNLVQSVTYEDVEELFGAVGALRKVKMVKPGSAEVFFINEVDAVTAINKYHLRELDGQPMSVVLANEKNRGDGDGLTVSSSSFQPLRLKKSVTKETVDIDPTILHHALFKPLSEQTSAVNFTVHM